MRLDLSISGEEDYISYTKYIQGQTRICKNVTSEDKCPANKTHHSAVRGQGEELVTFGASNSTRSSRLKAMCRQNGAFSSVLQPPGRFVSNGTLAYPLSPIRELHKFTGNGSNANGGRRRIVYFLSTLSPLIICEHRLPPNKKLPQPIYRHPLKTLAQFTAAKSHGMSQRPCTFKEMPPP